MSNWKAIARAKARKYGIPAQLFIRQMGAEASGQDLTSSAGAQGPAQIMPSTARAWGVKNVHDINAAYDAAAKHMAQYARQTGSYKGALEMYNLGHTAPDKQLPGETRAYIAKVLGGVKLPAGSSTSRYGMKSITVKEPGGTKTDVTSAILDALGSGTRPEKLGLKVLHNLASGYYDTQTKGKTYHVSSPTPSGTTLPDHNGHGVTVFDGKPVAAWIASELQYARRHGWKGTVISGVRTDAQQTRIYKSGVRPAAVPKSMGGPGSNHEGVAYPLGAVDVTDPEQLAAILEKRGSPLKWAGAKDPGHFSHPHGGGY